MANIVDKSGPPQKQDGAASAGPTSERTLQQTADQVPAEAPAADLLCTLQLLYSGRAGVVHEAPHHLHADSISLGRAPPSSGICLIDDDRVSRLHATVSPDGDGWRIADDGSRNGVFVNGLHVEKAVLRDGDLVRVGDSFLLFRATRERADSKIPTAPSHPATHALVGQSPAMVRLRQTLERVGPSDAEVLLLGESGTGKELTAQALHRLSPRAKGPFVPVNCATITEQLAESILFGHQKGSFTGAVNPSEGLFYAANHGTLFLDEIADLPRSVQPKLLRAIEQRQIVPVGATRTIDLSIRIVAATNRDLIKDIKQEQFRGELFSRLADVIIYLPPLRERKEDILPIFLSALSKTSARLMPSLAEALLLHPWPFNVRELLKIAKELRIKGEDRKELDLDLVSERLQMQKQLGECPPDIESHRRPIAALAAQESRIPSREELQELLRETDANISAIARKKQVSRIQVHRWLIARGLDKDSV